MDPRSDQESNTTGSDAEQLKSQAEQVTAQAAQWARETGREQLERAKRSGREEAEAARQQVADGAASVASAVNRTAETLDQQGQHSLASMADGFASDMDKLAQRLKDGSIDDLVSDTRMLAQRNPTLFLAGSIGVGIALARFLKASSRRAAGYSAQRYTTGDHSVDFTDEFNQDRDALADEAMGDDYPDKPASASGTGLEEDEVSMHTDTSDPTGNDGSEPDDTRPINRFE